MSRALAAGSGGSVALELDLAHLATCEHLSSSLTVLPGCDVLTPLRWASDTTADFSAFDMVGGRHSYSMYILLPASLQVSVETAAFSAMCGCRALPDRLLKFCAKMKFTLRRQVAFESRNLA